MKRTTIQILSIMQLMRRAYAKNFQGPFFTFGFPLIILLIICSIIISSPSLYEGELPSAMAGMKGFTLLSIVICLGAMSSSSIAVISIPGQIAQFKETIIIKRISITPIAKWQFIAAGILFGLLLAILSTLWIIAWSFVFFHSQIIDAVYHARSATKTKLATAHPYKIPFTALSFLSLIIGWLLVVLVANGLGMIIAGVAKNQQIALGMAMAIYFPMILLSGSTLPASYIENSVPLRIISYAMPIKYPIEIINLSFLFGGHGAFQLLNVNDASAFHWDMSIPSNRMYAKTGQSLYHDKIPAWSLFVISLGFISAFSAISLKTFRWEV